MAILFYGNSEIITEAYRSLEADNTVLWCAMQMFPNDPDLQFLMPNLSNRINFNKQILDFAKDPAEALYHHILLHLVVWNKFKKLV